MNKLNAYISAVELAIRVLDSAFVRSNAAETITPRTPFSDSAEMTDDERELLELVEVASYDVTPDHWGARLAMMSAFESLHAALRIISSKSAARNPQARAWREATARAAEAARLAACAERVFSGASRD
ncbi:MAG: hypothetical protein EOO26_06595 [Comamonadaceae bacterium]|nr:MAG: hypothetical protein EOO26_06595 [Comamonadaceae bacterium]